MFHNISWKCNHGNDPWKQQKWAWTAWRLLLKQKTSSYSSHQRHRKCPTLKVSNTPALLILCLQVTLHFPEIIILWTAMASWCFNQKTTFLCITLLTENPWRVQLCRWPELSTGRNFFKVSKGTQIVSLHLNSGKMICHFKSEFQIISIGFK